MENTKPHVILIAYHFPPGPEIGGFRPYRLYKYLKRMGYACYVITATKEAENASEDVMYLPDKPQAIRKGCSNERNGFWGNIELLARKLFFPGHIGLVWSVAVAARCRQIRAKHAKQRFVVFSTFPPLGVAIAGLLVRWRERLPWVADFRDPMEIDNKHVSRLANFAAYLLERTTFRNANAVVANVEGAASMLAARYPWMRPKLHVIWNGFDPEDTSRARTLPARPEKVIAHAGTLYLVRNPNLIVESLSRLRRKCPAEAHSFCILLIGPTEFRKSDLDALWEEAQRECWIQLRPPVPKREAQRILEESDGLLLIQPHTEIQVPGKLFEYICIGRPILALVPRSSAVEYILERAGVPYVCLHPDEDQQNFDRKLLEYLRLPAQATHYNEWFQQNFNAEYQARQLASIFEGLQ